MTELLSRPSRTAGASGGANGSPPRPVTTTALLGGLCAALITLVLCMAVALCGWFLADAGAHGDTTDALRVGADAWLLGLGAGLTFSGAPLGIVPLGLSALLVLAAFRTGRWSGSIGSPGEGAERSLPAAGAMFLISYGVVVVPAWVLSSTASASTSLGRALLGAIVVTLLGGLPGLAVGAGAAETLHARLPAWLRAGLLGAASAFLALVAAASLLVAVSLAVHLGEAATLISALHLGVGDALMLTVVTALLAPNCVFLAMAYLVGPGFAIGTGTSVTTSAVAMGALPAFPALAAIPADGQAPGWAVLFLAVPALAGGFGAAMAQLRAQDAAYDLAALRGAGAGVAGAVLVAVAVAVAGGPMGTGRMADIGAPALAVLAMGCASMGLGGLLAGLVTARWQRRGAVGDPADRVPGAVDGDVTPRPST